MSHEVFQKYHRIISHLLFWPAVLQCIIHVKTQLGVFSSQNPWGNVCLMHVFGSFLRACNFVYRTLWIQTGWLLGSGSRFFFFKFVKVLLSLKNKTFHVWNLRLLLFAEFNQFQNQNYLIAWHLDHDGNVQMINQKKLPGACVVHAYVPHLLIISR